ncbi:hypothetical protein I552_4664 [Mycobacterium xenopi 3993]|nr:hypothetical protein I552_4664 [Mycobacterium xenopi 3993]
MMLDLVSPELVDQVQLILRRLGIVSVVRQYINQAGNLTGQVFVPGFLERMKSSSSRSARTCTTTWAEEDRRARLTRSCTGGTCTESAN